MKRDVLSLGATSLAVRSLPRRKPPPLFAPETTHVARYWGMVGRQVLLFVGWRRREFFEASGLRLAAREVSQRGGGARRGSEATVTPPAGTARPEGSPPAGRC